MSDTEETTEDAEMETQEVDDAVAEAPVDDETPVAEESDTDVPDAAVTQENEAPADEAPAPEAPAVEALADEAPAPEASAEEAPAEEAPTEEAPAPEASAVEAPTQEAPTEEAPAEEAPAYIPEPENISPFDLPGDWFVIHSYSGYENKVKLNLETRTHSMHLEEKIFEVVIPMEDVVEIKNGKKVTVPRKMFPGYILCRMYLDDDSWYAVRNTPGVTGFVGSSNKPVPLSRREVEKFLGKVDEKEESAKAPRFKPAWEIGDSVRVVVGPFADFNGVIESINLDQSKVVVLVNIFGRDTPVELGFSDIIKN